jgi:hypothetical protein
MLRRTLVAGLFAVLLAGTASTARAQVEASADLTSRREKQKQVQAQTDQIVRRIGTMLRVLEYYELDKGAQKELLAEVATTLDGLSREQMTEIVARLEAAVKAPDEANADAEQSKAYLRHREVLDGMRKLLLRYDSIRDVQQLAARFEKAAYTQVDLHLQVHQLAWRAEQIFKPRPNYTYAPRGNPRDLLSMLQGQVDEQNDLAREIGHLYDQFRALERQLTPAQQTRLREFEWQDRRRRVPADLGLATQRLHARGRPDDWLRDWRFAADLQWGVAGDLQATTGLLLPALERLPALRVVRQRVDEAVRTQEALLRAAEVVKQRDPLTPPPEARIDRPVRGVRVKMRPDLVDNPAARQSQEVSAKQGRLEHEVRGTRRILLPLAKPLSERLPQVERWMRDARREMLDLAPDRAMPSQRQALEELRRLRSELDCLIAEAEKQRTDPLAALKNVAETIDQLIKEQKETKAQTVGAENARQPDKLSELSPVQQKMAERTDAVKLEPMPSREETQKALDKAARAMENAAKSLEDRKGKEAARKQDQAVKALEDAKKLVQGQIAEIEKRRDDIASLEDAAKKLDELARQESQVAEQAKAMAEQPAPEKNAELANKQGELTPQAKDLAKQVEQAAPEASKKVDAGAKHMEAAKNEIDKNKLDPASKEAKSSAQKLDEAMKDVAKALEQKKAQEIADQAAMNKQTPADAAQQLAKALEQTQQAQKQSKQSDAEMNKVGPQNELAKLQKQIADKADQLDLKEAGRPAGDAAESLQKNDLKQAIPEQSKALEKLKQAEAKEGEPGLPAPKAEAGEAKSGDPAEEPAGEAKALKRQPDAARSKEGQKAAGEAKDGQPKSGEAKADQPRAEEARPGAVKPAQPAEAQAKSGEPPPAEAKSGRPEPSETKAGQPQVGQAKSGQPSTGQEAKSGPSAIPSAQNAGQLAESQQKVLDATKALAESQKATQAAMAALAQAQAQAPQGVQPQLKQAAKDLAQASKQLDKGTPNDANQSQGKAVAQMEKALQTMNEALAKLGQPGAQPGQMAQAAPKPGQGQKTGEGQGEKPGQGQSQQAQGQKPGQGQGKKPGPAQEKNENRGTGQRLADGKVNDAASKLKPTQGEGTFLHLPPRQRELIQQALNQSLPPEYAAMIQQYYLNLARGRPAVMPNLPPKQP